MNENILSSRIAFLRREANMTQEQLAGRLGVTYQAVSKWENQQSCPDVMLLPAIADIFGVSVDYLFGRETPALVPAEDKAPQGGTSLPWDDDDCIYAAVFRGHELLTDEPLRDSGAAQRINFNWSGPAINVHSVLNVTCEDCEIQSVSAAGNVECGDVEGDVSAGGGIQCGDIGGSAFAEGGIECGDVVGGVTAGGGVDCGDVIGDVTAGGGVDCGDVVGKAHVSYSVDLSDMPELEGIKESVRQGLDAAREALKTIFGKNK